MVLTEKKDRLLMVEPLLLAEREWPSSFCLLQTHLEKMDLASTVCSGPDYLMFYAPGRGAAEVLSPQQFSSSPLQQPSPAALSSFQLEHGIGYVISRGQHRVRLGSSMRISRKLDASDGAVRSMRLKYLHAAQLCIGRQRLSFR